MLPERQHQNEAADYFGRHVAGCEEMISLFRGLFWNKVTLTQRILRYCNLDATMYCSFDGGGLAGESCK